MAALTFETSNSPQSDPGRGALLRLLDTLAERQMRHSHHVISRAAEWSDSDTRARRGHQKRSRWPLASLASASRSQSACATSSGVNQPSSGNERSSISPCDR
jgi:hypothetical protein